MARFLLAASLAGIAVATTACSFDKADAQPLAALGDAVASVAVDVGAPDDPDLASTLRGELAVTLSPADPAGCFALTNAATLDVDGVGPDYTDTGGSSTYSVDGRYDETTCEPPGFFVFPGAPQPVTTIALRDDSATRTIAVADLLANPRLSVAAPVHVGGTVRIHVDTAHPIARAAIVWWPSDPAATSWSVLAADFDLAMPGEIAFPLPRTAIAGSGRLDLGIALTPTADTCDFARCDIRIDAGGTLPITILAP